MIQLFRNKLQNDDFDLAPKIHSCTGSENNGASYKVFAHHGKSVSAGLAGEGRGKAAVFNVNEKQLFVLFLDLFHFSSIL